MSEAAIKIDHERFFVRAFVLNDGTETQWRQRLWFRFVSLRPLQGEPSFTASFRGPDGGPLVPLDPQPRGETVDATTRVLNVPLARDWTAVDVSFAFTSTDPDGKATSIAAGGHATLGTPLNTATPAPVVIAKPRRRRLSAWVRSSDVVVDNAKWSAAWRLAPRDASGKIIDPAKLAATEDATFGAPLRRLNGVLDDVSIIRTVSAVRKFADEVDVVVEDKDNPGQTKTIKVKRFEIGDLANPGATWDGLFVPGLTKVQVKSPGPKGMDEFHQVDARPDYCRSVLRVAHQNGLQVLAGYSIAEEGKEVSPMGTSFLKLLLGPAAAITKHAHDLIAFLWDKHQLDFDGLGLDIELVQFGAQHAPGMRTFVGALADDLLARGGKIVTFATGVGVATVDGKLVASPAGAPGFAKGQPFDLAKGRTNVIARPMAYDVELEDPKLNEWHEAVVRWGLQKKPAADAVGDLEPGQLQLGVKIVPNSAVKSMPTKLGKTKGTLVGQPKGVAARCSTYLSALDVGLIVFAMGDASKATVDNLILWNDALNAGEAKVPAGTPGEPIQAPAPKSQAKA